MRLYSRTGVASIDDPDFGHFEADEDGSFDLPQPLGVRLHRFAVAGERMWETDIERQHRLIAEEDARRRDPATLLAAVNALVDQAQRGHADEDEDDAPKAPARRRKAPAKKPADD